MEHPFIAALKREGDRLNAGRETYIDGPKIFHHMGHEREAAFPWLSDVQIAGEVRMLMRDNPMHEAIVCAGRDRILHLSEEVARLRETAKDARALATAVIDAKVGCMPLEEMRAIAARIISANPF